LTQAPRTRVGKCFFENSFRWFFIPSPLSTVSLLFNKYLKQTHKITLKIQKSVMGVKEGIKIPRGSTRCPKKIHKKSIKRIRMLFTIEVFHDKTKQLFETLKNLRG